MIWIKAVPSGMILLLGYYASFSRTQKLLGLWWNKVGWRTIGLGVEMQFLTISLVPWPLGTFIAYPHSWLVHWCRQALAGPSCQFVILWAIWYPCGPLIALRTSNQNYKINLTSSMTNTTGIHLSRVLSHLLAPSTTTTFVNSAALSICLTLVFLPDRLRTAVSQDSSTRVKQSGESKLSLG